MLYDGRHQGAGEPFVVLQELRLACCASVLDTNANQGPGGMEAQGTKGIADHLVDVLSIGRGSISVTGDLPGQCQGLAASVR